MSYILDALRRADAERGRAGVPRLHTQSVLPDAGDEAPRRQVPPFVWMGVGALGVLVAALAWSLTGREQPAPAPASEPAVVTAPPVGATPAAAASPAPTPAMAAAPASPVAPLPEPVVPLRPQAPMAAKPRAAGQPSTAVQAPTDSRARAPQAQAARPAPVQPPRERLYALHELPESVRRAMPRLDVGGSIYSPTPASRFLIINGQIYHEGDAVTPELTLEEIRLKAAVLRFRDHRVQITY